MAMTALVGISLGVIAAALMVVGFGPDLLAWINERRRRAGERKLARIAARGHYVPDPGRELRAERKAEQLLLGVIGPEAFEAYRALGFLPVYGPPDADGRPSYGYLIYPHRPLVSFDARSRALLSEYCVAFPDRSEPAHGERLPDADDVLAKWMALRGDERGLIAAANMHLPGRQLDPDQVRRDLSRLGEWSAEALTTAGPAPSFGVAT